MHWDAAPPLDLTREIALDLAAPGRAFDVADDDRVEVLRVSPARDHLRGVARLRHRHPDLEPLLPQDRGGVLDDPVLLLDLEPIRLKSGVRKAQRRAVHARDRQDGDLRVLWRCERDRAGY